MVITRIRGGLGNQLFQYAAGLALAEYHKTILKIDDYTYHKRLPGSHTKRMLALHRLNVTCQVASRSEVHRYTGNNPLARFINKTKNYAGCEKVFAQPHFHYYERFLELPADIYLSGYWQSEKYFTSVGEQIGKAFTTAEKWTEKNEQLARDMATSESVSIHVRAGDLTSRKRYSSFFGVLPRAYYEEAVKRISNELENPCYFVFTDDVEHATGILDFLDNKTLVTHNTGQDSYWDMMLMRNCMHNIIANSTFSWWGAWLNEYPQKLVIAPKKWFRQQAPGNTQTAYASREYDIKDLYPSTWLTL